MLPDPVGALPDWLVVGVALGGVLALGVAATFALGVRAFPSPTVRADRRDGGEERRRAEIRAYLEDIGEPYREDHPVADRTAPFYLPERGVAITFDARDYFRLEGDGVRTVLLEYEVPGARIGSRLPFETPEPADADGDDVAGGRERGTRWRRRARSAARAGRAAAGDRPGDATAFAALGLPEDASAAAVRAAYRERVKEVHPDLGGDRESFRRLREAYTAARKRAE